MDDDAQVAARVFEIADDLSSAGILARASAYFEAGGDIELSGEQYATAVSAYRRAIALERQRGSAQPHLVRKLARALLLSGCAEEAALVLEQLASERADKHEAARDLTLLEMAHWVNADIEASVQHATQAVERSADAVARFENLTNVAYLNYELGDVGAAQAALRRAPLPPHTVPRDVRARFHDVTGRIKMSIGSVEAALEDFRRAMRLIAGCSDTDLYFAIFGNYADNVQLLGDFEEALHIWKRLYAHAHSARMGWHVPDTALHCSAILTALGQLDEALRLYTIAKEHDVGCAAVRIQSASVGIPLGLALERSDLVDENADQDVLSLAFRSKESVRIGPTVAAFCEWHLSHGRTGAAGDLLNRAVEAVRGADHAYAMLALATQYAAPRSADRAGALLLEVVQRRGDRHSHAFAAYGETFSLLRGGDRENARRKALEAAEHFAALRLPMWHARALEAGGRAREALALYERIGHAQASNRLRDLFARRKSRAAAAGELTDRQRQIVGLIRNGLSNREIGAQLGISEKTVGNHLQAIYGRTRCGSRAKLMARYAST